MSNAKNRMLWELQYVRAFACIALVGAIMGLAACAGCHQAVTSSEPTGGVSVETEEETPVTAADVPLPADYADAVKKLFEYRDAIRQAVSSGHLHDAHRPLDETSIALERLPAIAKASGVPRRHWEAIVVAGDDLGESLGEIHEAIDAGQSPDYAAHAAAIDDALQRLQALAEQPVGESGSEEKAP